MCWLSHLAFAKTVAVANKKSFLQCATYSVDVGNLGNCNLIPWTSFIFSCFLLLPHSYFPIVILILAFITLCVCALLFNQQLYSYIVNETIQLNVSSWKTYCGNTVQKRPSGVRKSKSTSLKLCAEMVKVVMALWIIGSTNLFDVFNVQRRLTFYPPRNYAAFGCHLPFYSNWKYTLQIKRAAVRSNLTKFIEMISLDEDLIRKTTKRKKRLRIESKPHLPQGIADVELDSWIN